MRWGGPKGQKKEGLVREFYWLSVRQLGVQLGWLEKRPSVNPIW
jgi:hypothetical protein